MEKRAGARARSRRRPNFRTRRASATNTDTTLTRAPNEEAPNGCTSPYHRIIPRSRTTPHHCSRRFVCPGLDLQRAGSRDAALRTPGVRFPPRLDHHWRVCRYGRLRLKGIAARTESTHGRRLPAEVRRRAGLED